MQILNDILLSIFLQPLMLILYYLGKVMNAVISLDFSFLFSSSGLRAFILTLTTILLLIMLILYVIGLQRLKYNNERFAQNDSRSQLTKRLMLGLFAIFITPLIIFGVFLLGAIFKSLSSLIGLKEISFVQSLYSFAKVKDINAMIDIANQNNIKMVDINNTLNNTHLIINLQGIGMQYFSFGSNEDVSINYIEINNTMIDLMLQRSDVGVGLITYDYIIVPIVISVALLFIILPLIVSVLSRLFSMLINYILLYITYAVNIIANKGMAQKQILRLFSDIIILSTYGLLFFIVQLIQSSIITTLIASKIVVSVGWIGLNLMIAFIIFTGTTIASLWPTYLVQTIFGDDQLVSQINSTNQNLWRRTSNAFRTSAMVVSQGVGIAANLFKKGNNQK